jgi:hypothetical protein
MELKDYCRNTDIELTAWKAKLYDIIRKMDKMPTSSKEKMYGEINALNMLMAELDDRIQTLRTSCPTDWSPEQKEISNKLTILNKKYQTATATYFDYDFGG